MDAIENILKQATDSLNTAKTKLAEVAERRPVMCQQVTDLLKTYSEVKDDLIDEQVTFASALVNILCGFLGETKLSLKLSDLVSYELNKDDTTLDVILSAGEDGQTTITLEDFGINSEDERFVNAFWCVSQFLVDQIQTVLKDESHRFSQEVRTMLGLITSFGSAEKPEETPA